MTGRHAGATHDSLFWGVARLAGATILVIVVVAVPLGVIGLAIYFVFTGSDLTSFSILWVMWAAILIASIIERDKRNRFSCGWQPSSLSSSRFSSPARLRRYAARCGAILRILRPVMTPGDRAR